MSFHFALHKERIMLYSYCELKVDQYVAAHSIFSYMVG